MGIFDKAKDVVEDAADKAGDLAGKAKESISGVADEHGHKVTGAVGKGTDFVDDKTGGKITGVTDKVDELTERAVNALRSNPQSGPPSTPPAVPPAE